MTIPKKSRYLDSRWVLLVFAMGMACAVQSSYAQVVQDGGRKDSGPVGSEPKRDPFWPVGYTPSGGQKPDKESTTLEGASSSEKNWNEAMKQVVINGVSSRSDSEYFAIINGEVKSVGDTVSVKRGGLTYSWLVEGIEPPGSVKLRRASVR